MKVLLGGRVRATGERRAALQGCGASRRSGWSTGGEAGEAGEQVWAKVKGTAFRPPPGLAARNEADIPENKTRSQGKEDGGNRGACQREAITSSEGLQEVSRHLLPKGGDTLPALPCRRSTSPE